MHNQGRSQSFYVFGSLRADVFMFIGTCLIAIGAALLAPSYMHSHLFLVLLIALFDAPHVACGLYFMLTNSKDRPVLFYKIIAIFLTSLVLCLALAYFRQKEILLIAFAHLSVWHFARQHQAWFKLAGRHSGEQSGIFKFCNSLTSYAATWLIVMASLCGEDRFGWFGVNDLILFPAGFKVLFFGVLALSLTGYLIIHGLHFLRTRQVMLSQHLVLISMLLVWILARHTDDTYMKAALIFIPHSVTYFYLLFRSTPARSLINFKFIAVILTVIFGSFHFYIMTMAPEQVNAPLDGLGILIAFTLAMSITHAFSDRLYWNSKDNPGWSKPLAIS